MPPRKITMIQRNVVDGEIVDSMVTVSVVLDETVM